MQDYNDKFVNTISKHIDTLDDSAKNLAAVSEILMIVDEWTQSQGEGAAYYHLLENTLRRTESSLTSMSKELSDLQR